MAENLVCVIGGGIGGLAFAALHRQRGGEAMVLERSHRETSKEDGKSVVIGSRAADILAEAGAPAEGAPLSEVQVMFENAPGGMQIGGSRLGLGISHHDVRRHLSDLLGDNAHFGASVEDIEPRPDGAQVRWLGTDGRTHETAAAAVVVACELPALPPPFRASRIDFGQAMLSFSAVAEGLPEGRAVEAFTRRGIIAVVPRHDGRSGVIACAAETAMGRLSSLDDSDLLDEICARIGGGFRLHSPSSRFVYAPVGKRTRPLAAGRVALIGVGATLLHPAGAQGLNLALADAEDLSRRLASEAPEAALAGYARRRARAHEAAYTFTCMLGAGGHLRHLPFRIAGGLASGALSLAPWQKFLG